jgi:thioredoxin 1
MDVNHILLGILGLFMALFFMMQIVPMLLVRSVKGKQPPEIRGLLNDHQDPMARMLFYFWSPSCGMCRSVTPVIDELIQTRDDLVSIDITQHSELARACRIMGTPAFAILDHAVIDSIVLGARTRPQIMRMLED